MYDWLRVSGFRPPSNDEPRRIPAYLAEYLRDATKARASGDPPPDITALPGSPHVNLALLLPQREFRHLRYTPSEVALPAAVSFRGSLTQDGSGWLWRLPVDSEDEAAPERFPTTVEFHEARIAAAPPTGAEEKAAIEKATPS